MNRSTPLSVVADLVFDNNGTRLATIGNGVRIWSVESGEELHTLQGAMVLPFSLASAPDIQRLALAGQQGLSLCETEADDRVIELAGHGGQVLSISFHPDGNRFAALSSTIFMAAATTGTITIQ